MDTQRVTLKQLEAALPTVLEQHEGDLIEQTRAGRVLVVMQAPNTAVDPDGGFRWMVRAIEPQEITAIAGVDLVGAIQRCRESNGYPIVLVADKVQLVRLQNRWIS